MADLGQFDATVVEPLGAPDPVPAGKYEAAIIASEMKPTKSGTGSYLELRFEILEGEYRGRSLWTRLNLDNPNSKAVEIAQKELSAICRAVGVLRPADSRELHDLPLIVDVRCRKRSDTGEISNEIKGYVAKSAPPPAATSSNTAPWKRAS